MQTNENPPKLETVEIVASYSGKIATGRYENEAPFFSLKEAWSGMADEEFIKEFTEARQSILSNMCYKKFSECEQRALIDKIKEQRKDIRFYGDYPSVTSIIGWDEDWYITPEQLVQYGARGTIIHKQAEIFLTEGVWKEPKDIPEIYTQMVILKKGSLGLSLDGYDFPAFMTKNPMEIVSTETKVLNDEHRYGGRQDFKAKYKDKVYICDIKTGSINKTKCFKQLSAYANCPGNEDVQGLMIVPLNSTTQQGYSKAVIEEDVNRYFPMFLDDRKSFTERFGC